MGQSGCDGAWREECVELHRRWLIDGQTRADEMRMPDGTALPTQLRPRPSEALMTGDGVMQALQTHLEARVSGKKFGWRCHGGSG